MPGISQSFRLNVSVLRTWNKEGVKEDAGNKMKGTTSACVIADGHVNVYAMEHYLSRLLRLEHTEYVAWKLSG